MKRVQNGGVLFVLGCVISLNKSWHGGYEENSLALYIYKGDNGERMKEESVMMLTTQARGTEFLAHHTHIDFFFVAFLFSIFMFLDSFCFHLFLFLFLNGKYYVTLLL